jgi:hypothetical protein
MESTLAFQVPVIYAQHCGALKRHVSGSFPLCWKKDEQQKSSNIYKINTMMWHILYKECVFRNTYRKESPVQKIREDRTDRHGVLY